MQPQRRSPRASWRLWPAICEFTSEIFYESRLESKDTSVYQGLIGIDALAGSKLWDFDVAHEACTSSCDEEVEAVLDLVTTLTSPGATISSTN